MIPSRLILLLDDDSAFVAQSDVVPFYGYMAPTAFVAKDSRSYITKDNRSILSRDNRSIIGKDSRSFVEKSAISIVRK